MSIKARLEKIEKAAAGALHAADPSVKVIEIRKDCGDHIEIEVVDISAGNWHIIELRRELATPTASRSH